MKSLKTVITEIRNNIHYTDTTQQTDKNKYLITAEINGMQFNSQCIYSKNDIILKLNIDDAKFSELHQPNNLREKF